MILGIHQSNHFVYEGESRNTGIPINPLPLISQVGFGHHFEEIKLELKTSTRFSDFKYIFREDSYDPVSRTRRGRIYKASTTKPESWSIIPHPGHLARKDQLTGEGQLQMQSLYSFYNFLLSSLYQTNKEIRNLSVLIGAGDVFTKWTIISNEVGFNGQEIVTLKATNTLDIIPDIDYEKIDISERNTINEKIDKFLDVSYSASIESIVDRAGEACLAIITAMLRSSNSELKGLTLDSAIKKLSSDGKFSERKMLMTAAELLRLLHSRGKLSFQDKYNTRALNYHDAQMAIDCLSIIVFEFDLAK